jgi:hypothetical protein
MGIPLVTFCISIIIIMIAEVFESQHSIEDFAKLLPV